MSFREKMAWIQMLATLAAYGVYFTIAFSRLASGHGQDLLGLFIGLTIVVIILTGVPAAIVAMRTSKAEMRQADERERVIELKSAWYALMVLNGLLWVGVLGLLIGFDPILMANLLLLVLVVSELVRWSARIIQLRQIG